MKRILVAAALAAAPFTLAAQTKPVTAPATSATDAAKQAKVQELFAAMHVERASEQMVKTMQGMVAHAAESAPGAQDATPEQRKIMAEYEQKAMDLAVKSIGWEAMKPVYSQIYAADFTDAELDGMIAFYHSPSGKALLEKLPDIGQQTMKIVQERMQALQPQLQQITTDYGNKMKATAPAPKSPDTGK
ncbi:hypothetical protein SAMN05421819_0061 [Bryocella elongata]|uniref:DUF2059 domain-containing protein n=1 Tax=Bryocella elongata TaxID=863522 RepID=A0A1H5S3C1_9BACT|nr:DUF2059 domain-containing protein [Bryocella elongata]SEF45095.1 hypothetical protein SAMN05421819_0061 [Bryocella elongata]